MQLVVNFYLVNLWLIEEQLIYCFPPPPPPYWTCHLSSFPPSPPLPSLICWLHFLGIHDKCLIFPRATTQALEPRRSIPGAEDIQVSPRTPACHTQLPQSRPEHRQKRCSHCRENLACTGHICSSLPSLDALHGAGVWRQVILWLSHLSRKDFCSGRVTVTDVYLQVLCKTPTSNIEMDHSPGKNMLLLLLLYQSR